MRFILKSGKPFAFAGLWQTFKSPENTIMKSCTIITTTAQIIMNMVDFSMDIKAAVEAPRFHHQWLPDIIQFEEQGFSSETIQALELRGHDVMRRDSIGEANCIQVEGSYIFGAADSRRNSSAVGY